MAKALTTAAVEKPSPGAKRPAVKARKRLTAAAVERYRPGPKRREIPDGAGLYLVVHPSGTKSWILRHRRPDGRPGKLTLGPVDFSGKEPEGDPVLGTPLTLASARALAAEQLRQRKRGSDIAAQRIADKRQQKQAVADLAGNSFPGLARKFIDEHARPKTRRWHDAARLFGLNYPDHDGEPTEIKGGLVQRWRDRDVGSIDGGDLYGIVDEARRRGIPGLARRRDGASDTQGRAVASALSKLFSWLVEHRKITSNPAVGMYKPAAPEARDRVLSESEIRLFWAACEHLGQPYVSLLRLLLLTGCRRDEIADLTRGELSEDGGVWTIPATRTKNRRPHVVYLAPLARELISAATDIEGQYVFTTNGAVPVSGWSKLKRRIDGFMLAAAKKEGANIPAWRLHDLRRTAVTQMAEIGIMPHVVEAVVNHVSGHKGGVAGIYNRSELRAEKKAALERWARYIVLLVDRDLHAAHSRLIADDDKAREAFIDALAEGGERWARYLKSLASGGSDNVINMPRKGDAS